MFSQEVIDRLKEKLEAAKIKEREGGGGKRLKYLKGDTVIDTANDIFGYGQWGYEIASCEYMPMPEGKGIYRAYVKLSVAGAAFPFPGDGVGTVTNQKIESHEKAIKEASTDALKRAFRHLGDQFGLSLYDEDDYVINADGDEVQLKHLNKPTPAPRQQQQRPQQTQPTQQPVQSSTPLASERQIQDVQKWWEKAERKGQPETRGLTAVKAQALVTELVNEFKERNRARNGAEK